MVIGDRIKELRNEKSLTQEKLAKDLGIGRSTLGLYETGLRQVPNELLIKIAKYFDISADYLLGIEEFPRKLNP